MPGRIQRAFKTALNCRTEILLVALVAFKSPCAATVQILSFFRHLCKEIIALQVGTGFTPESWWWQNVASFTILEFCFFFFFQIQPPIIQNNKKKKSLKNQGKGKTHTHTHNMKICSQLPEIAYFSSCIILFHQRIWHFHLPTTQVRCGSIAGSAVSFKLIFNSPRIISWSSNQTESGIIWILESSLWIGLDRLRFRFEMFFCCRLPSATLTVLDFLKRKSQIPILFFVYCIHISANLAVVLQHCSGHLWKWVHIVLNKVKVRKHSFQSLQKAAVHSLCFRILWNTLQM